MVSTGSTELHKIKTVAATVLEIHGTFVHATAAAARECVGHTFNQIGEITDFAGPGGAAAVIDITNINSTAKQKLIGIRDEGQVSMTLNYNATDTGQAKMRSYRSQRQSAKYSVIFTDSSVGATAFPTWMYFDGYCLQFSVSGAVDNKVTANAVIEIEGPVFTSTKATSG